MRIGSGVDNIDVKAAGELGKLLTTFSAYLQAEVAWQWASYICRRIFEVDIFESGDHELVNVA